VRENKLCKNWEKCSKIATQNNITFSCDTCDGTALANNAGITVCKPSSETKVCHGLICKQMGPDGVRLPISDFGKNRVAPDGLQWNCKKCICESVRIAKLNRKNKGAQETGELIKVLVNDPLYEKLIKRLNYHKSEVEKIERVLETIKEITGKEVPI